VPAPGLLRVIQACDQKGPIVWKLFGYHASSLASAFVAAAGRGGNSSLHDLVKPRLEQVGLNLRHRAELRDDIAVIAIAPV